MTMMCDPCETWVSPNVCSSLLSDGREMTIWSCPSCAQMFSVYTPKPLQQTSCPECDGKGWYWSLVGPGDIEKEPCDVCGVWMQGPAVAVEDFA